MKEKSFSKWSEYYGDSVKSIVNDRERLQITSRIRTGNPGRNLFYGNYMASIRELTDGFEG